MTSMTQWKKRENKKALLITGARQIGKTYTVRKFASENYENVLEINFAETPSAKLIFDGDLDAKSIISNLTAFSNTQLVENKTLIFFDEIQECPNARAAIKYLVEDGRFDYIESGSLLGVLYKDVPLLPIGYEEILHMYPLSLREFFVAMGVQKKTLKLIKTCYKKRNPVPEAIHNKMQRLTRLYLAIGGMPAAANAYINTNDLAYVHSVQKDIIELYRMDITRYANNKPHVKMIFDAIPSQLSSVNKRFILKNISATARMERYASDFMWLVDAGVALPCYNIRAPQEPLAINEQRNLFKLYACDIGLLGAMLEEPIQFELIKGNAGINQGSILENLAAQELHSHKFKLRYFDKSKYGEIDFIISSNGNVIPIEIKSGHDYKKHKALDNILKVDEWNIDTSIAFCADNVSEENKITYLPWYMLMFIKKQEIKQSF